MKAAIARVIVAGIPEDADAPEPRIVGFFNVPTAFIADLRDAELSTLKVYLCLCSNANNQTKRTFISVPRIAAKTGICVRSVHYALRWLESRKWIKANRSRTRGDVTRYKVWFHPHLTHATECTPAT